MVKSLKRCEDDDSFDQVVEFFDEGTNPNLRSFLDGLRILMKDLGLRPGDVVYDHFGKTSNGQIVILDYGFDNDNEQKFFGHRFERSSGNANFPRKKQTKFTSSLRSNARRRNSQDARYG
jgi:hypothetical protein